MNVIDKYVAGIVESTEILVKKGHVKPWGHLSYIEKCHHAMDLTARQLPELAGKSYEEGSFVPCMLRVQALMSCFVLPDFVARADIHARAFLVTRRLVEDLDGSRIPDNLPKDYFCPGEGAYVRFIDVPYGAFDCGDGLFLRGIFYCVKRDVASYPEGFVSLMFSRANQKEFCYLVHAENPDCPAGEEAYLSLGEVAYSDGLIERARNLAMLVVLHHDSKAAQGEHFNDLPMYPAPETDKRALKKRGKSSPKYSVLRMVDLRYDGEYRRASERSETPGRSLAHPVKVRGHFRWQAWGPKWSKRRLVWLDSYTKCSERGEDTRAEAVVL